MLVRRCWRSAAACVAIGLLPALAVPPALRVGALVAGAADAGDRRDRRRRSRPLPSEPARGPRSAGARRCVWLVLAWRASRAPRRAPPAPTWACAFAALTPRMQYTASSFAAPLLAAFRPARRRPHASRDATGFHTHATRSGPRRRDRAGVDGGSRDARGGSARSSRAGCRCTCCTSIGACSPLLVYLDGSPERAPMTAVDWCALASLAVLLVAPRFPASPRGRRPC